MRPENVSTMPDTPADFKKSKERQYPDKVTEIQITLFADVAHTNR
jgi:hypothetical protein